MRLSTLASIASSEFGDAGRGTRWQITVSPKLEIICHESRVHLRSKRLQCCSALTVLTVMPSPTISELDTLFHQLQRRMIESGEWERCDFFSRSGRSQLNSLIVCRILLQLRYQLNDAGWLDSTRAHTLGTSIFYGR